MKIPKHLLEGAAISAGARVFHVNHQLAGKEVRKRTLYKMPNGKLTFMDGTPVRAGELIPDQKYEIIFHPSCFEKGTTQ
jgi:hypothetical protein